MKTVKCKWCGEDTTMLGTRECDRCWELRSRIEADMVLAKNMIAIIEDEREKEAKTAYCPQCEKALSRCKCDFH